MTPAIKRHIDEIRNGNVPNGYKKTLLGVVPDDWIVGRFKDMFERVTRKNKEKNDNVLTISAQHGLINQNDFFNKTVASDDKSNYYLLEKGEFAYNKSYSTGYPLGALKRLEFYDKGIVSPLYICFKATEENKHPTYYTQYFEAGLMNGEIQAFAQEGARNHGLLNISVDDFFNSNLLIPSVGEQKKIAKILETEDRVIALKEKLIEAKLQQKKALVQRLLTVGNGNPFNIKLGKVCIDKKKWKKCPLDQVVEKVGTQVDTQKDELYTQIGIKSHGKGLFYKEPVSGKSIGNKSIFWIEPNCFILNIVFAWEQAVGKTTEQEKGLVCSHRFPMFKPINNAVDVDFLVCYFLTKTGQNLLDAASPGGAGRNRTLGQDHFLKSEINLPSLPEQQAIAKVLSAADREIDLLRKDLEQEKLKKKSMMQLLLTGLVRVA